MYHCIFIYIYIYMHTYTSYTYKHRVNNAVSGLTEMASLVKLRPGQMPSENANWKLTKVFYERSDGSPWDWSRPGSWHRKLARIQAAVGPDTIAVPLEELRWHNLFGDLLVPEQAAVQGNYTGWFAANPKNVPS